MPPRTIIIRHRKENLKKCTLRGLESHPSLHFFTYPQGINRLPSLENTLLLAVDGDPLSEKDQGKHLLLIDATWRLSKKIIHSLPPLPKRSLPSAIKTAYPRRQEDCPLPDQGLASIEALYLAWKLLGVEYETLLDNYHWKLEFLYKNKNCF